MPRPSTVIRLVSLMEDMPLMDLPSPFCGFCPDMKVPLASGLKVFLMRMGMFLWKAGKMVGGKITLAPKLHSSMASTYVSCSMT